MLHPHDWDDVAHRAAIHEAFDRLQLELHRCSAATGGWGKNHGRLSHLASHWMNKLRELTDDAERRRVALLEVDMLMRELQWPTDEMMAS